MHVFKSASFSQLAGAVSRQPSIILVGLARGPQTPLYIRAQLDTVEDTMRQHKMDFKLIGTMPH